MVGWRSVVCLGLLGVALGAGSGYLQYRHEEPTFFQLVAGKTPKSIAKSPDARPRVVVENGIDHDYGVMELGETKKHDFLIRNHTDKPLSLSIVDTTCKCTVGNLPDEAIPPGETGTVTLEWIAKIYAPDFRQSATLRTSDEINQLVVLSVHGHVIEAVHADPPTVAFSAVTFGSSRSQEISLVAYDAEELEVRAMEWLDPASADRFRCDWRPMRDDELFGDPKPKIGLVGTLTVKEGMPLGPFREELTLKLQSGKERIVGIPVEGRVVSDVSLVGQGFREESQVLEFGVVEAGVGATRRLRMIVKGPHHEGFQVVGSSADPEGILEVVVGERIPLENKAVAIFPLDISIRKDAKPISRIGLQGRPAGKIELETTHPIVKKIPIEVRFAVVEVGQVGKSSPP